MRGFLRYLTMTAAAVALIAGFTTSSARRAYAQDNTDADTGAWAAPGADTDEATTPDSKAPPIPLAECWEGDIEDKEDDGLIGSITFFFTQDGSKITSDSDLDAEWTSSYYFYGPIHGKVTSKGITFKGNAGKGCPFHGSAKGDDTELGGKIELGGKCGKYYKHVTFSVSPVPCI
jgi:hypothetical protein